MRWFLIKLYVRLHYMWFYIKHPSIWWTMKKLSNRRGWFDMYDNEHDTIDWSRFFTWVSIIFGTGFIWYSIFFNGFFVTLMWVIVVSAIIGIVIKMWDMRL